MVTYSAAAMESEHPYLYTYQYPVVAPRNLSSNFAKMIQVSPPAVGVAPRTRHHSPTQNHQIQGMVGHRCSGTMTSAGTGVFLPRPKAYGGGTVVFQDVPLVTPARKVRKRGVNRGKDRETSNVKKSEEMNQVREKKESETESELSKDNYLFLPEEWCYLPL